MLVNIKFSHFEKPQLTLLHASEFPASEGDLIRYLGLPVDFSVMPYESELNKDNLYIVILFIFTEYYNAKENIKNKFLLRMKILPRIPLKGGIQNAATHDFEIVNFYCWQLS